MFVSRQNNQSQLWIPRKPRKIGVWVSGVEIQTSAVDTRTAVWVSTAEKIFKIVLGETWNFSRKFGGVSAPALYKNPGRYIVFHLPYFFRLPLSLISLCCPSLSYLLSHGERSQRCREVPEEDVEEPWQGFRGSARSQRSARLARLACIHRLRRVRFRV